ncbi:hypothetical protein B6N60_01267 [Richelia sinica FACHB-800]|uniref:Uncharacterized protein n=1 Tax=Richelia sinica FACHB-800 TaxID=1357546 RepID=A0A975T5U1_9NOST|nr:hypothetical protein B6N60_01267 [Richelia sinica FACHB-800]
MSSHNFTSIYHEAGKKWWLMKEIEQVLYLASVSL